MGLKFGDTKGGAQKTSIDQYKYKDGDNSVRLVGDVLARYVYWIKGENDKAIPVECLEFNRDTEEFDRAEKDWVKTYFPDKKCSWNYAINCIDPSDGKVKVLNLKKKLFDQILTTAEDLGDPTDPETGWDVKFKKVKTGPLPINVEYQVQPLKCKPRPLTEEEKKAVADMTTIDSLFPRPTPDQQKEFLEKVAAGGNAENHDESISEDFETN